MEKKERKGKPIKEIVFSTRNKPVILYSKIYGVEKTNEILDNCFSNDMIISKLLEAQKHGFKLHIHNEKNISKLSDTEKHSYLHILGTVCLTKEIYKLELDRTECEKKYWENVKENLLKIYDEEITDAIIEHYHPLILEDSEVLNWNWITVLVSDDTTDDVWITDLVSGDVPPDAKKVAIYIEFYPDLVKEYSNIEKKVGNKIIKYPIECEKVASVFIDSHIQVFGKY